MTNISRHSDPLSSHIAAAEIIDSGTASGHEALIVATLKAQQGLTAKQIGERVRLSNVQICRRLAAMEKRGKIRRTKGEAPCHELRVWLPDETKQQTTLF